MMSLSHYLIGTLIQVIWPGAGWDAGRLCVLLCGHLACGL